MIRSRSTGDHPPKGGLKESEVQPFLKWLFSDLAVNCKPLKLSPGAAAIRHLMNVAWHGVPTGIVRQGPEAISAYLVAPRDEQTRLSQKALRQMASILWGNLWNLHNSTQVARKRRSAFSTRIGRSVSTRI